MKTTKLQLNATSFKATRDTISAYIAFQFDLAVELDKARKATDAIAKVIATDNEELLSLVMGNTDGIIRDRKTIEESIKVNTATYKAKFASYNAMYEKSKDVATKAKSLFGDKESALYKAYVAYVESPSDDNYNAYADAMAKCFVGLGLADATADNVAYYMPNVDKAMRGKSAVKKGDIQSAVGVGVFADAIIRKIYAQNKSMFANAKFAEYVRKCAEKAKKNA